MKLKLPFFFIWTLYYLFSVTPALHAQVTDSGAQWTWISGVTALNHRGIAPVRGVAATTNMPSARFDHCSWSDNDGNLWMFGGDFNNHNRLNDLWKYDISHDTWTWVSGGFSPNTDAGFNNFGVYGARGIAAATNLPGARRGSTCWKDAAGNFWLLGGWGRAENGGDTYMNDMWRYNPVTGIWTWISGEKTGNPAGNYGTKGVAAATNQPRARGGVYTSGAGAVWVDAAGNFWMFGGYGRDITNTTLAQLNDLWKYDPVADMWTWIGGANTTNEAGNYGTKGVAAATNQPGARYAAMYWTDNAGKFWMFGGYGIDRTGAEGRLNDLWNYDPVTNLWTWRHGSDLRDVNGVYGTRGVPAAANTPGARVSTGVGDNWVDMNGRLWMYGGSGFGDGTAAVGRLQDLWRYDPATNEWAWMKGSGSVSQVVGVYGTIKVTAPANQPGGRDDYVRWTDSAGNFWLLGGIATTNSKNDLWRLAPVTPPVPPVAPGQPGLYTQAKNTVCAGETVLFSVAPVAGAASYEWIYTGTGVSFPATTTFPSNNLVFATNATNGTVRVRAVNAAGASAYRDTAVTIISAPTVSATAAGGASSFCQGDSLLLSASASTSNVTYQWKQGTANVGANSNTYHAKATGSYTVTVTHTTTNCTATSTPALQLTAHALPAITITPSGAVSICQGDSLLLTASIASGVSYQWLNGTSLVGANSREHYVHTAGSYTVRVTDLTTNCVATANPAANVTVRSLPVVSVAPAGARAICQGDSLLLTATASGSRISYQWRQGSTVVNHGGMYYAAATGDYTVRVIDSATNCTAVSDPPVQLRVHPLPVIGVTPPGPAAFCGDDSVVLTASSGAGVTYEWRNSSVYAGTGPVYTAKATGNYKVIVTEPISGCRDSSSVVEITAHSLPVASLTPVDTAFCAGGVAMLRVVTHDTGLVFSWWDETNTAIPLAFADFLERDQAGVYTVVVGRSGIANCTDTTNPAVVTVHALPEVEISWDGEWLHATPGYAAYQWYTAGQPVPAATDDAYQPPVNGEYSVRATDNNGCSSVSLVLDTKNVGIDFEPLAGNIRVYPNPSDGLVHVDAPVPVNVILSTISGKVLFSASGITAVDIRDYADGVYLLQLSDTEGRFLKVEKLIKSYRR